MCHGFEVVFFRPTLVADALTLNPDGSDPDEGTVYLYRYAEDEDGIPQIDSITDDDEYEAAADRFDEMLDDDYFNALEDEE